MALEHLKSALVQFTPSLFIFLVCIITPLIGVATEKSETICTQKSAVVVHNIAFCWIMIVTVVYLIVGELGMIGTPTDLQLQGRYFFLKIFRDRETAGKLFGGILQFLVVFYWAILMGPEPLTCWSTITKDNLAKFEFLRVSCFAIFGATLVTILYIVNRYSTVQNTTVEESAPIIPVATTL